MRYFSARRELVRIADASRHLLRFLTRRREGAPSANAKIFAGTMSDLQYAVAKLVQFFGVPYRDGSGVTLAGLRPGGATWAYLSNEPLSSIHGRGRWACQRTLKRYIHEAASCTVWSPCHRNCSYSCSYSVPVRGLFCILSEFLAGNVLLGYSAACDSSCILVSVWLIIFTEASSAPVHEPA